MASTWRRALVLTAALALASAAIGDEEENPFKGDADATSECYTWAADGQCAANPGYMHSSCKYSCWEWYEYRAKKFPDAPWLEEDSRSEVRRPTS